MARRIKAAPAHLRKRRDADNPDGRDGSKAPAPILRINMMGGAGRRAVVQFRPETYGACRSHRTPAIATERIPPPSYNAWRIGSPP